MNKGDLVVFSGSYTVYNPFKERVMIEMNVQPKQGIVLDIDNDKVTVLSTDDVFCTLQLDDEASQIHVISSV